MHGFEKWDVSMEAKDGSDRRLIIAIVVVAVALVAFIVWYVLSRSKPSTDEPEPVTTESTYQGPMTFELPEI